MLVGCVEGLGLRGEKRERERPENSFRRPKTSDDLTDYTVDIVIRWGVKRTPNAMKFGRQSTYTMTRPFSNSHPIPRTFSGHL